MREILFKAKYKYDGEWKVGGIVHQTDFYGLKVDKYFIIDGTETEDNDIGYNYEVIPETVSQFTGLYDKNGVRIWENDIVIIGGNKSFPTVVEFLSGSWQCVRKYTNKGRENEYSYLHRLEYDNPNKYEVIGNRFDNSDLLKGE